MLLNTEEMWKAQEVLYYFLTIHKMSNNKSSEMFSMSKQNSSSFWINTFKRKMMLLAIIAAICLLNLQKGKYHLFCLYIHIRVDLKKIDLTSYFW